MVVKILAIGDIHCSHKNWMSVGKALDLVVDIALKEKVDLVLQAGDVWDYYNISGKQVSVGTLVNAVKHRLLRLAKNQIPSIIIQGNHDKAPKGSAGELHRSSISLLEDDGGWIRTVEEAKTIALNNGLSIVCLPWQADFERPSIEQIVKEADEAENHEGNCRVILGHFVYEGSQQFNHELTSGDFFLTKEDEAKIGALTTIAGHIHHRQGPYVGTLLQNDLRDAGSANGVRIIEIDTSANKIISDKFVDIRVPQWKLIELDSDNESEIQDILKSANDFDKYVIRVNSKKTKHFTTPPNVEIRHTPPLEHVSRLNLTREQADKMSLASMFSMWAEFCNHSQSEISDCLAYLKELNIC